MALLKGFNVTILLEATKITFPLGTRTAPEHWSALSPDGTDVKKVVTGLQYPRFDDVPGHMRTRPSGKRSVPEKSPRPDGPPATFPYTGVGLVAHQDRTGWDAALHVEDIHV